MAKVDSKGAALTDTTKWMKIIDGREEELDELKSAFSSAMCGTFYVPSEYALGYLDTSGAIQPSINRVTFGEYLKMAVPTEVIIDSGYAITLCLYDENKNMTNRYNINSIAYIQPNTFFRITIRNSADSTVTDVDEWAHHCHLKWAVSGIAAPLVSTDNLNDIKDVGIYSPSQTPMPSNWPVAEGESSGAYGVLLVHKASTGAIYQAVLDTGNCFYFRRCSSSGTWNTWTEMAKAATMSNTLMPADTGSVTSNTYATILPDADLASAGRTYFIAASVKSTMTANLPVYEKWGYLVTFKTMTGNAHGLAQIYITKDGELWHRGETGSGTTHNWGSWTSAAAYTDTLAAHPLAAKIFKRVGCIGDSYTEGYIKYGSGSAVHLPAYAWPHYMEALTGNIWTNFGVSGSSSKSWMQGGTYSKLSDVQAAGNKCQAYVIGLMLNDSTTNSPNYVAVGTSADIGTDANSYYAYYYKLIATVHAVNADAPIFCNTCPQTASRLTAYNQAVRDIVAYCKQQNMPVYLCDLAGTKYFTKQYYANPIFTTDYLNSHYSTIGYEMMAECYLRVLSDIIIENVTDFQGVHLIDYDMPNN